MKTEWNETIDEGLLQCVEYFTRTGFNRQANGAVGTWKLKVGFWKAVASALSYHMQMENGPTPAACEKRWEHVFEKYTDPNDPFPRVHTDSGIDLSEYEDAWGTASSVVIDYQHEQIERAIATLRTIIDHVGDAASEAYWLSELLSAGLEDGHE